MKDRWDDILLTAGCSDEVRAHCATVAETAREYGADGLSDRDLIEAGSFLHDIGRSHTHGVDHAQVGAAL